MSTVNGKAAEPEVDLYGVLNLPKTATKDEIKKAYRKAALQNHPDKVAADQRQDAEIKFKEVSAAYEILYDDEKRQMYDTHGMAAFQPGGGGMGPEVDLNDILGQMFGMGGGMPSGFGGRPGPRRPRRGADEEQVYPVTLEDLYKGKTVKFALTKRVLCTVCKGVGGKDKTKAKPCSNCHGRGVTTGLRSIGPGLVTQETVSCSTCKGSGEIFKDKDRCKKCKGNRTTEEKKTLEIYIPRGAKHGEKIVLEGEADQAPDVTPGDVVFILNEADHEVFRRAGADLQADINITLAEALCGFSRVVIQHLDGRGIFVDHPQGKVFSPNQTLKITGEGMPYKKSDAKGNLYLTVKVTFPEDGWLKDTTSFSKLQEILPNPQNPIAADTVDEVEYDSSASIQDFGSETGRGKSAWEDEEGEEEEGRPQCTQQ
ncbi:MAG: hypothetical protein M1825_003234 [Sarcosagium campestre]|nr:MAG: hypothetical protein M1825_003234 [Sarcosagium campestre]